MTIFLSLNNTKRSLAGLFGLRVYALHDKHQRILILLAFLIIIQLVLGVVSTTLNEVQNRADRFLAQLINLGLSSHTSTNDILVTALLSGTNSCIIDLHLPQVLLG